MLVIPLLGLVFFSGKQFLAAQTTSVEAASMEKLTKIAVAINQVLDELRLEKGITEKYQKSRLKKFGSETESARADTNQANSHLNSVLADINISVYGQEFVSAVNAFGEEMALIEEKRSAINEKKLRKDKAAKYYSALNDQLLNVVERLPGLSPSKDSAIISTAYGIFLHIKDLAARERQVLANVFKRDQFVGKEFANLNSAVDGQKVYQALFLSLVSAELKDFYTTTVAGDYVEKTREMREKAFQASDYGAFNIEPELWVTQQSGKINLLNKVADKLTSILQTKTEKMAEMASNSLVSASLISIFSILVTLILGYLIQKGIRDSVQSTLKIVDRIAQGDLSNKIQITTKDEMGEILRSIDKMQTDLNQRIENEARVARINARIKQALDNVSANVLVTDASNQIIYINDAALNMFGHAEKNLMQEIEDYSADSMLGSNIGMFQQLESYQLSATDDLDKAHETGFRIGGSTLRFTVNPVMDDHGERLGTVLECQDRTEEVEIEHQIHNLVLGVRQGDLTQHLETSGKSGFYLNLAEGMNSMVDTISDSLDDIKQVMSSLARGDLSHKIERDHQGTFGEVSQNVNQTINQFSEVVGQILESSEEMKHTSKEIESGNNDLSSRTEKQASALEETASSMEEITSTVKQNADNAQQANSLATQASDTANTGGEIVDQAIQAMSDINQASTRIAEIIGVIDEIAFQTNLLALNASVEAARAGEQGRGFAVVATEVRNLAGRSATAAKEIKELIQDSVNKVNTGSELVNQSGDTLQEIVQGVRKLGDIVGEIAAAGEEQAKGIEQVNKAVANMDEATQQNAALAEQTSAASVSMSEHTYSMAKRVQFFNLSNDQSIKIEVVSGAEEAAKVEKLTQEPFENVVKLKPSNIHNTADENSEWQEF